MTGTAWPYAISPHTIDQRQTRSPSTQSSPWREARTGAFRTDGVTLAYTTVHGANIDDVTNGLGRSLTRHTGPHVTTVTTIHLLGSYGLRRHNLVFRPDGNTTSFVYNAGERAYPVFTLPSVPTLSCPILCGLPGDPACGRQRKPLALYFLARDRVIDAPHRILLIRHRAQVIKAACSDIKYGEGSGHVSRTWRQCRDNQYDGQTVVLLLRRKAVMFGLRIRRPPA